jgi:hypothetical protein
MRTRIILVAVAAFVLGALCDRFAKIMAYDKLIESQAIDKSKCGTK